MHGVRTHSSIVTTGSIIHHRLVATGIVVAATRISIQRIIPDRGIVYTIVGIERLKSVGHIITAGRVGIQGSETNGRIICSAGIDIHGSETNRCIVATGIAVQGLVTQC
ncbi:hypothetical protein D3C72_997170 [compost metagenome]